MGALVHFKALKWLTNSMYNRNLKTGQKKKKVTKSIWLGAVSLPMGVSFWLFYFIWSTWGCPQPATGFTKLFSPMKDENVSALVLQLG